MKLLLSLVALSFIPQSFAGTNFGGIEFHSSVPRSQSEALSRDLTYIFRNPVTQTDKEFLQIAKMSKGDGPEQHNWILNRVRYILGESYKMAEENFVAKRFTFPNTPLQVLEKGSNLINENAKVVVMSNMGAAFYIGGKQQRVAFGLKLDGKDVYATSPRVGILQVGEGLFLQRLQPNQLNPLSTANSISRVSTLFHEARHSDGTGLSTAFAHMVCPIGHSFAGLNACDNSGNGPYTIGGLSQRQMLKNCTDCTTQEKRILEAITADSFDRVINASHLSRMAALEKSIKTYQELVKVYEGLRLSGPAAETIADEIKKLKNNIASAKFELEQLKNAKSVIPMLDDSPEGEFKTISLKESVNLMVKSLRR